MKRFGSIVAITALAAAGCGGGDDTTGDSGDSGGSDQDFCAVLADVAGDLEVEDFDAAVSAYRRISDAAPGDLSDDLELAVEAFEKISEWAEDPTSDYPFSDDEDVAIEDALNRIDARATEECGAIVGEIADGDDAMDEPTDDGGDVMDEPTDDGDDAMDEPTDDGDDVIASDGESTLGGDLGGDLPDGFPFPVPATYEVGSQFWFEDDSGQTFTAVLNVPEEDFDDAAALYRAFLDDGGFEVTTTEFGTDAERMVWLGGERDDVRADITMSVEEVANDAAGNLLYETTISLSWIPKS